MLLQTFFSGKSNFSLRNNKLDRLDSSESVKWTSLREWSLGQRAGLAGLGCVWARDGRPGSCKVLHQAGKMLQSATRTLITEDLRWARQEGRQSQSTGMKGNRHRKKAKQWSEAAANNTVKIEGWELRCRQGVNIFWGIIFTCSSAVRNLPTVGFRDNESGPVTMAFLFSQPITSCTWNTTSLENM